MHARGQVSLESLLIWAALAGALALFTPAFTNLMQAYSIQEQVMEMRVVSHQLEAAFTQLSFQAPGSRVSFGWNYPSAQLQATSEGLEIQLNHASLQSPKVFTAKSPIPILLSFQQPATLLVITRIEGGIRVESQ